jgi:dienelactone hydrolase
MRQWLTLVVIGWLHAAALAQNAPLGETTGTAWEHTPQSLALSVQQGDLCLPARVTGTQVVCGKFKDLASQASASRVPVVLFLHGSSGLGLKAIGEWQRWLAGQGYASLAPDSFALTGRVTYKSPIDKIAYERIHALRASEIAPALAALQAQAWADTRRLVLAGASEGAVPVARHADAAFAARIIYAWSCEDNYFVQSARNAFPAQQPVLNVISTVDPFFSSSNSWLGGTSAKGHCGVALAGNPQSAVVLVPDAPHTLLNWPAARLATAGFLTMLGMP